MVDIVCEQFQISTSPYNTTLCVLDPITKQITHKVVFPLSVAKQFALGVRKHLSDIEAKSGQIIEIPEAVLKGLNVSAEDWPLWKPPPVGG